MAHKQLEDGRVVVDWTTGDPEGDRIVLLSAYRDFIREVYKIQFKNRYTKIEELFIKWGVNTVDQVDEVPRIWIKRPE